MEIILKIILVLQIQKILIFLNWEIEKQILMLQNLEKAVDTVFLLSYKYASTI